MVKTLVYRRVSLGVPMATRLVPRVVSNEAIVCGGLNHAVSVVDVVYPGKPKGIRDAG